VNYPVSNDLVSRAFLIVGHGLVGSSLFAELQADRTARVETLKYVRWSSLPDAQRAISESVHRFLLSHDELERVIIWTAGISTPRSSLDLVKADQELLRGLLQTCHTTQMSTGHLRGKLKIFFASSAGGVYARSKRPPFSELSEPEPDSFYGESKLKCELEVASLTHEIGASCVIGRLSTVYGVGQNLAKPQGILSHLVASSARRQSTTIYASLDTIRNYIYSADAARLIAHHIRESDETIRIANICSPFHSSLGSVIETVRNVSGFRTILTVSRNLTGSREPRDLRIRSRHQVEVQSVCRTNLPEGVHKLLQAELRRIQDC